MQRENKIRMAVIGLGEMGKKHAALIDAGQVENMELTCVCVHKESGLAWTAEHLGKSVRAVVGIDNLFRHDKEFDALLIATPHRDHLESMRYACRYGKHVFCEKPAGISVSEADDMEEEAKKSGIIYTLMFHHRKYECYKDLKRLLDEKKVGTIFRIEQECCMYRTDYYHQSGKWRSSWRGEGGGLLINQGQHVLDMWQWLFGMPKAVRAEISWGKYNDFAVDDEVRILMKYEDKRQASLFMTTGEPGKRDRLSIIGSLGRMDLDGNKLTILDYGEDSLEYGKSARVLSDSEMKMHTSCRVYPTEYANAYTEMLQEFAEAVLGKKEISVTGSDGICALELANASYLSAWEDKWISLPIDRAQYDRKLEERVLYEEEMRLG